jgi:hypothetical protein
MKAETCSCYVLLIKYILCYKVVLDCKLIYIGVCYNERGGILSADVA